MAQPQARRAAQESPQGLYAAEGHVATIFAATTQSRVCAVKNVQLRKAKTFP